MEYLRDTLQRLDPKPDDNRCNNLTQKVVRHMSDVKKPVVAILDVFIKPIHNVPISKVELDVVLNKMINDVNKVELSGGFVQMYNDSNRFLSVEENFDDQYIFESIKTAMESFEGHFTNTSSTYDYRLVGATVTFNMYKPIYF